MTDEKTGGSGSEIDDFFDGSDPVEDTDDGQTGDAASDEAGDGGGSSASADAEERVRKMQSERDTAVSDRNKMKRERDEALKRASGEPAGGKDAEPAGGMSADDRMWVQASKQSYRDQLYDSDPRMNELGLSRDLIQGATPADMKASFEALQGSVTKMTSGIRNAVLTEHGLAPEPAGGERRTPVNYETMSKEEFDKVAEAALAE